MDRHQLGNRQFIVGRRHHQEISCFRQGQNEPGGSIQLPLPPSIHNFPDGVCQLRVGQAGFGLSRIEDLHHYSLTTSRSLLSLASRLFLAYGYKQVGPRLCASAQSGVIFAPCGPTSPLAQASRLARLAVIRLEAIARAALVPEDVGLVSEDHVAGDGVVGWRRPFEALGYDHPAREAGGSGWNVMDDVVVFDLHAPGPEQRNSDSGERRGTFKGRTRARVVHYLVTMHVKHTRRTW